MYLQNWLNDIATNEDYALADEDRDAFAAPGLGVVRFLRDASGRVTEASVSQERVWDLRFKKRAASAF